MKNPSFFADYIIIWVLPKMVVPQIIHFNRVFHYKPSILGYPYFWKHPYLFGSLKVLGEPNPGPGSFFTMLVTWVPGSPKKKAAQKGGFPTWVVEDRGECLLKRIILFFTK